MNLTTIAKVAFRSLRRTLLRSTLTGLGIIIGVAAVIVMMSLVNGAKSSVEATLTKLDSNQLMIHASMPLRREGLAIPVPPGDGLRRTDYEAIQDEMPDLMAVSVQVTTRDARISAYGRSDNALVVGVDVDEFKLSSRRIVSGTRFGLMDVQNATAVCVISEFVARTFFPERDPVGEFARIQNIPFLVIGVLADGPMRDPMRPTGGDTTVLLPYTSLLRKLDRDASFSITVKPKSPGELQNVQREVSNLLERRRGSRQAEFITGNVENIVAAYRESNRALALLYGSIGGVSLLVGGLGVMNIMLVNVTERTREIGIRMAIGTRSRDIRIQFLIEAVIICVLGGAVGVLLGIGTAELLTYLNGWATHVTLTSVLAAALVTAIIGIVFGYYPARRAAQLDPIEALRSE